MSRIRATWVGFGAVLLWSLLALLTVAVAGVPPFQLVALCFALGGALGLGWIAAGGRGLAALRGVSPVVWLVGIGGLFGYHLCYFIALRLAPPAQASLIAYLWPLLIVLFSGLLPGESLRPAHIVGAMLAFAGAALVILGPGAGFAVTALPGYAAAAACAVIWAGYSVLSRRLGTAPTETVAVFCLATSGLALVAHLALETTVWPQGGWAWAALVALGTGPVGLAFYLWDIGVKRGDIQLLGVASYAAPLISTLAMIAAGYAEASLGLLLSAALIAGGALVAAKATAGRTASSVDRGLAEIDGFEADGPARPGRTPL